MKILTGLYHLRHPPTSPETVHPVPPNSENGKQTPPPPPPVPREHIKGHPVKGGVFYFEGKQITGKEAVQIAKKNNEINSLVRNHKSKKAIVKLSKDPIVVD